MRFGEGSGTRGEEAARRPMASPPLAQRLWMGAAGVALVAGGFVWFAKLWVIVSTDGQVMYTGAAGVFFSLGLGLLLVGSTGVGLRLAANEELALRVVAAAAMPVLSALSFAVFSSVGYAIIAVGRVFVGDALPSYLLEEGGVFISAMVGVAAGLWLLRVGATRGASGGSRGLGRGPHQRVL